MVGRSGSGGLPRWSARLFVIGLLIVSIGAAGDVLFHTLPADFNERLELLLGRDGNRAHLVTLVGMILTVLGLGTYAGQRQRPVE